VSDKSPTNALLSSLSATDVAELQLQPIELPRSKHLERGGRRTEHAYFIDRGIASVLAAGAAGPHIEIGMVGREGMTGLTAIMGAEQSPYDTFMQVGGSGWQAPVAAVRHAVDTNAAFRSRILDYTQAFLAHVSATAAINAHNKLEERLARWLLVARDRTDTDEMAFTHDFIAQMLGVRRAGVTLALNELQQRGLIEGARGRVRIVDRDGLRRQANGAYTPADEVLRNRVM
jgi:CRP-like cAMP-binding protein